MARGGRRAGGGHPTNAAVEARSAGVTDEQRRFVQGAQALLPEALETLKILALGVWVEGCSRCRRVVRDCRCPDPDKVRFYQKPPDRQALEILVEHGRGRAQQAAAQATDTTIQLMTSVPRPKGVAR